MSTIRTPGRHITVDDVARRAGVSRATAARALGGYGTVGAQAKEKVLAAAAALDYRPNELARSMMTGRSGTIGVVVGDIENAYFALAVRGISDVAKAHGFNVILANTGENVETEKAAIGVLVGKRVDGIIVTPARLSDTAHLRHLQHSARPLVLLDRSIPGLDIDTVVLDDRSAAEEATRLLIEAGHRRISYVSATVAADALYRGPAAIDLSTVLARIEGVTAACRKAGIDDTERHIRLGVTDAPAAERIVVGLMAGPDRPTAILASDSMVGLNVFKALRSLGLSIPRDVSFICFHDADWTGVTSPPITVIDQPVYELGRQAAEVVIRRIGGGGGPAARLVLPTRLIARASVGAPAV